MGKEINKTQFSRADFIRFNESLHNETQLLNHMFENQEFADEGLIVGLEVEGWLVDQKMAPFSISDEFIQKINSPFVVHELMKFNFELNATPLNLKKDCLLELEKELTELWSQCVGAAHSLNAHPVLIGMLPTAKVKDFKIKRMSNLMRYHALNEQILKKRQNRQIDLSISGVEQHIDRFYDILLEASTTSTQIHLQLPPKQALDYFNAAIYLSAATVAISSNSPYFFNCHLWEETRIPVFEQIVYMENEKDPKGRKRTGFGAYLNESIMECFERNLESFSPILPVQISDDPNELEHLRLHNGTIWRWNRPIIGKSGDKWHIRLEHRPISSGPTIQDIIANIAFFVGASHALVKNKIDFKKRVNELQAKANFYSAARYGLSAKIREKDRVTKLRKVFLKHYIPLMESGLKDLKFSQASIDKYVEIIKGRVTTRQTGAKWQAKFIKTHGKDFHKMVAAYIEKQNTGQPVHTWNVE